MARSAAHPENSPHEMVEEVDRDGHVVRLVTRQQMRQQMLRHRAVFIAVVSHANELLVHRRSLSKDIWPGWWDVAVGGVMAPGESGLDAAQRELAEEVGLTGVDVVPLGSGAYEDSNVKLVAESYMCRSDGPFTFSDGEVTETAWVPLNQVMGWLETHQVLPDSVALVLPRLPMGL